MKKKRKRKRKKKRKKTRKKKREKRGKKRIKRGEKKEKEEEKWRREGCLSGRGSSLEIIPAHHRGSLRYEYPPWPVRNAEDERCEERWC